MKITAAQLRSIIKEEVKMALREPAVFNMQQRAELESQIARVKQRVASFGRRGAAVDDSLILDYLSDGDPYDRLAELADEQIDPESREMEDLISSIDEYVLSAVKKTAR